MTDYTQLTLGCDVSHFQVKVDWPTLAATGAGYVVIKATQGMGTDPLFLANADAAADAGFITFAYAYLTADDTEETVQNFLTVTGGMIPALDYEQPGVPAEIPNMWADVCQTKLGRPGLAYYGLYPPDAISPLVMTWPRWFPEYAAAPRLPAWDGVSAPDWSKEWLIWQYTGNGREPGVTTAIDLNRCAVSLDVLRRWHDTGSFAAPT